MTETSETELIEEPKGPFLLSIPEVHMMAGNAYSEKSEVPTLTNFTFEQFTDKDCSTVFASAGRLNTRFDVDSDGILASESPLNSA